MKSYKLPFPNHNRMKLKIKAVKLTNRYKLAKTFWLIEEIREISNTCRYMKTKMLHMKLLRCNANNALHIYL